MPRSSKVDLAVCANAMPHTEIKKLIDYWLVPRLVAEYLCVEPKTLQGTDSEHTSDAGKHIEGEALSSSVV